MSYSFEGITKVIFRNPLIPSPDVRLWADGETRGESIKTNHITRRLDTNANTGQLKCWDAVAKDDRGGGICLTIVKVSQHFITMRSLQSNKSIRKVKMCLFDTKQIVSQK